MVALESDVGSGSASGSFPSDDSVTTDIDEAAARAVAADPDAMVSNLLNTAAAATTAPVQASWVGMCFEPVVEDVFLA